MEFLFIGLVFGVLSALVAQNKGRRFGLWFVLGFLFGIFAFIVVLCLPRVGPAQQVTLRVPRVEVEPTRDMVKCDFCAELILPDAKGCRYCGRPVTARG